MHETKTRIAGVRRLLAAVPLLSAGLVISAAAQAQIPSGYTIEPLLPPGAPHSVSARGLYDDGTLGLEVSRGADNAVGNVDAWVRFPDGTWMVAEIPAGNNQINQLGAIGPDGTMYGTWRVNNNIFDQRAFIYTPDGVFTDLGRLPNQAGNPSNTFFGTANADYAMCRTANLGYAYRVADGEILDLPVIREGLGLASAFGSNSGNWFVGVSPSDDGSRATLWRLDPDGEFEAHNMGLPPDPIPDATSNGRGINEHGVAVGYTGTFTDNDAFIWTEADGMSVLPRLDPARSHFAYDINDAGIVAGYRAISGSEVGAVVWDSSTGEGFDLLPLVENPQGWNSLLSANYINNHGQIQGRGTYNGLRTVFLLTPIVDDIPGDINGDGCVDHADLALLLSAYGSTPGDPNWNPDADITGDGEVGHADLALLLAHYGEGC